MIVGNLFEEKTGQFYNHHLLDTPLTIDNSINYITTNYKTQSGIYPVHFIIRLSFILCLHLLLTKLK